MRLLSEIENTECCETCGEYFDAADQRGAVCPDCCGVDNALTVETCEGCGTVVEQYGNVCSRCMETAVTRVKNETFAFDKFMDKIVIDETRAQRKIESDTPQRARIKRTHEHPINKVKVQR